MKKLFGVLSVTVMVFVGCNDNGNGKPDGGDAGMSDGSQTTSDKGSTTSDTGSDTGSVTLPDGSASDSAVVTGDGGGAAFDKWGKACTGQTQGECGDSQGTACLISPNATKGLCSKSCTTAGAACAGIPAQTVGACVFSVKDPNGGADTLFCGFLCKFTDPNTNQQQTATCPGDSVCGSAPAGKDGKGNDVFVCEAPAN